LILGKEPALSEPEGKTDEGSADHRAQTRLWLRFLPARHDRYELRRQFREEFDFTMPRFDVLAQLDREHGGLVLVNCRSA